MKKLLISAMATMFAASVYAGGQGHSHAQDAIGVPGKAGKVNRTVSVDMTDTMRFIPANVSAKQGETIRFIVKNSGKLKHEFVLGTENELKEHYEQMKKFPEMEHVDPNMVTVAPGKTGEVIWQFTKAGKIDFACLQPGHYDGGMKGYVEVAQASGSAAPTASTKAAATGEMADGEVRKIDKENKKITLKHGEIKSMDMPGMTMVFQVKDPTMLDAVKQGDKVKFKAERSGGAIVVTEMEVAK